MVSGGGIFSRMLQCAIIPMADLDFDNAYLVLSGFALLDDQDPYAIASWQAVDRNYNAMLEYGIDDPYAQIVNYVLDQKLDRSYEYQGWLPQGTMYDRNNPIENSTRLADYRRVLKKLKINNSIHSRSDQFVQDLGISSKTLGVHVRLTSMSLHTNYVQVTYDDYVRKIDQALYTGLYENIYVATDNIESLVKLENRYARYIRYFPNLLRLPNETIDSIDEFAWEYDMFFKRRFWQESFLEAMTLGKCGGLVCRDSNFSNMAIVFGESVKKVYRVDNVAN